MKRFVILALALAACGLDLGGPPTTPADMVEEPPATPEEVVSGLLLALRQRSLEEAVAFTDPTQFPLVVIVEGLGARRFAELGPAEFEMAAANFWSGFADQVNASLGPGLAELSVTSATTREVGASRFAVLELTSPSADSVRSLVLRHTGPGWVVDLVASFPSPFLGAIPAAADIARQLGDEVLRQQVNEFEDSVRFVLDTPGLAPQLNQAAVAALEAIGR